MRSTKKRRRLDATEPRIQMFAYILFGISSVIVVFPLLVILFAAFKDAHEYASTSSLAIPVHWHGENFYEAFRRGNILRGYLNTGLLIVLSVFMNIILGAMTAFSLNRFDFKLKKYVVSLFAAAMIIPVVVTEVARFQIIKALGFYNTLFAPLVIYMGTDLLQIYLFLQFIEKVPISLDESAMLDGASPFMVFRKIVFPLLLPGAATVGIVKAVEIMNDMYVPYLYMPAVELRTLSTALMSFVGERFSDMNVMAAAIIVIVVPALVLYLFTQKLIFAGITAGAVRE